MKDSIERQRIENLWQNNSNWTWGIIYCCAEDPRSIVPRRWRWGGWTLNFCHPKAGIVGMAAFGLAVGPALPTHFLLGNQTISVIIMFLSIIALIVWAHPESSRMR